MEGRAIARPNPIKPRGNVRTEEPSMEGRAIARPNSEMSQVAAPAGFLQWRAEQLPGQTTGRRRGPAAVDDPFNGGPSNCPAKHPAAAPQHLTAAAPFNGGPSNCPAKLRLCPGGQYPRERPSMEGRAIARPNPPRISAWTLPVTTSFNGGPSNCPAKPCGIELVPNTSIPLQWRAEQLPGQTVVSEGM